MSRPVPSKLAGPSFPYLVEGRLGQGTAGQVLAVRDTEGRALALKLAESVGADVWTEAERLLFARSRALPALVDAGRIPAGVKGLEERSGHPFVVLERAPGEALEPAVLRPHEQRAVALSVARDVGEALADLHQSGSSHGDVKPSNIVVARSKSVTRAMLVDLGLTARSDEAVPRGATPRYLPLEGASSDVMGDGRGRDLYALGLTLAEIASAKVARSKQPAREALAGALPAELGALILPLLAEAPGARPSASWVRRRALALLGQEDDGASQEDRGRRAVERAYLAVRRRELGARRPLEVEVGGAPGAWLREAVLLVKKLARVRGAASEAPPARLSDLDAFGRARWLVALIGPAASQWPKTSHASDEALSERLLELCHGTDPSAFTYAAIESGAGSARELPRDAIGLALALGAGGVDARLLDLAERELRARPNDALARALGHTLCLRAELGRALSVLETSHAVEARLEAAEVARRSGDAEGALRRARELPDEPRARAIAARVALDRGELERAAELTAEAGEHAAVHEVRALCELAKGERGEALASVERGLSVALGAEERARLEAVRGGSFHAAGEAEPALESFRRAVDYAVRSGAVVEEATYATGLAAAAANLGRLGEALEAARRAVLLFEHLGRPRDAARAALARAATFAAAGAVAETRDAVADALARARAADDRRCSAYLHMALADVLPEEDLDGAEHADRALALVSADDAGDRLRAEARRLRRGRAVDVALLDAASRGVDVAPEVRLEWWGARARGETRSERPSRPDAILAELAALTHVRAPPSVRGPAFADGARLAARAGDGDRARRFGAVARNAAAELLEHAPEELSRAVRELPWLGALPLAPEPAVSSEQVADVESLVYALGRRDRLRPLLDQVLDALISWTGVERGLLLLRAPGDRLVPRAARNLAKDDLSHDQLALSHTLAERALSLAEPVVAVDAAGELPELHASVHALKLRSVLAVPLIARGEALGVVYLDDRVRRGAFGPAELAWVRLLGALAAVAIADARDRVLLRRSARKAKRAEARLGEELARREALLDVAEHELAKTRARDTRFRYLEIVGESDALRSLLRTVDRVAIADVPVLIAGESGSGKELIARAIHDNSARARHRFVSENCAAIPETLLESTLFGHVRGAFTGASRARAGLFEVADGGTLFLDEIAEMSLGMQTKLLRVLQDGEVHALGSERTRRVDVRVIGATHRDLDERVRSGAFRQDLLFRLNVIRLEVPALRQRRGDIPLLVRHFLGKHAEGRPVRVTREAMDRLAQFAWPGNIRQLENEIRRALVLSDDVIELAHLSPEILSAASAGPKPEHELGLRARVDELERSLVERALAKTGGNQTRAAELLGLSRFGLQKMMKRLAIGQDPRAGRRPGTAVVRER